jgi:hypothetical protein
MQLIRPSVRQWQHIRYPVEVHEGVHVDEVVGGISVLAKDSILEK